MGFDRAQVFATLARLKDASAQGLLSEEDAVLWYSIVVELRRQADYYERGLIRHLKWSQGLYWREIARILEVDSKQGAHQRWRRLIEGD